MVEAYEKNITLMEGPVCFLERDELMVGAAWMEARNRGRRVRKVEVLNMLADIVGNWFKLYMKYLNL